MKFNQESGLFVVISKTLMRFIAVTRRALMPFFHLKAALEKQ